MTRLSRSRSRTSTFAAAAALALALWLPSGDAAFAQDGYRLFYRWSLVLGGYFESTDTDLRLDGSIPGSGVPIDLEGELGLDASDTLFRARMDFLPGEHHQFSFGYYSLDRDASRTISRDIEFGGEVFPVDGEVSAFTNIEVLEGSYTWWFARGERAAFGGTLGLVYLTVEAGIEATALGAGVSVREDASTDLPVPVVGVALRFGLLEELILHANAEFLPSVTVGDVDGSLTNLAVALEWRPFEHVGFGAGYNLLEVDLDVDRSSYSGEVKYQIQGGQAYLRFGW